MDAARPGTPNNLLTLQQAADYLAVNIDVLLIWNDHHILKPTITSYGEVAYTKEQLDKFKLIQSSANRNISRETKTIENTNPPSIQKVNSSPISPVIKTYNHKQENNFSQIHNYNFYSNTNQMPSVNQREKKTAFSILGVFATLSFFGLVAVFVIFSQQSKVDNMLNQTNEKEVGYDSTNSTIRTMDSKESIAANKNKKTLDDKSKDAISGNSQVLDAAFEKDKSKVSDNENEEVIESILGNSNDDNSNLVTNTDIGIVTYGQKANFRESSYDEYSEKDDAVTEVFDTEGNIKVSRSDPSESDLLATALGVNGFSQTQNIVKHNTSSTGVFTFIILGLLFMYFIYSSRRQLIPARSNSELLNNMAVQPISFNTQNDLEWEKLIEINQKTDGSVVINFQDKEYKISKPELDSESDKFIERLMQLTNNGEKEIEYDVLLDLELSTNTPLSKIVTRLGFIGLKRDLFFPRTSKSRVLFRKYLTLDDLFSMNLTIEDLSDRINNIN